jgi:hypothetical protein
MPGCAIVRPFGVTLGYEPAARLDSVPGQDLSRQMIAVHDGRIYKLVFVSANESHRNALVTVRRPLVRIVPPRAPAPSDRWAPQRLAQSAPRTV